MIPKKVHYCWFGGAEMPKMVKWCIKSWKKYLPDYEFKLWNENNFDVNSIPFVKEAYQARKWAYVTDYVRLYALYTEGGIYLDSDEKVLKPLDEFLKYDFVASHEYFTGIFETERTKLNPQTSLPYNPNEKIKGLYILAAPLFAIKGHPFIKDCMNYYENNHFMFQEGTEIHKEQIIGRIITKIGEKYGYIYNAKEQNLKNGMIIKRPEIFVNHAMFLCSKSYIVHLSLASWNDQIPKDTFSRYLQMHYPSLSYQKLLIKNQLRRIKHLFLSREKVKRIKGIFDEND
jgi:mannosyltransferase OCH1-like enzyme